MSSPMLLGPSNEDRQWQAKARTCFDVAHFRVDWDAQLVTCPQGRPSARWYNTQTARVEMIHVDFAPADCTLCPLCSQCTRAKALPRSLTLQPQAEHEAIQPAGRRQQTLESAAQYARRAGFEGTLSQGVRAFGLRLARYRVWPRRACSTSRRRHPSTSTASSIG